MRALKNRVFLGVAETIVGQASRCCGVGIVQCSDHSHPKLPKGCDDAEEIIIFGCKKAYRLLRGQCFTFFPSQVITQIQARLDISPLKVRCVLLL